MIKITIAIPTYNQSEYLDKCLNSIFRQNYPLIKYEVIVVDDSSTDNTIEVLKGYTQKYNNIRVVRNKENRGPYYSRNRCVDLSKGEIIAFLDSDCIVPADWLSKIGKKYKDPITCIQGTQKCGGKWGKYMMEEEKHLTVLKSMGAIDTKNFIIKRDIISKYMYNANTYSLGDLDLGLRLKDNNIEICYYSDIVVTHLCDNFDEVISRGKRFGKGAAFIYKKYGKILNPIFKFPSPIIFTCYFLLFFVFLVKHKSFRGALAKSTNHYFMAIYFRKYIKKIGKKKIIDKP